MPIAIPVRTRAIPAIRGERQRLTQDNNAQDHGRDGVERQVQNGRRRRQPAQSPHEQRELYLHESAERVPTNILSERLKRLEQWGLVRREPYQQKPVRHTYHLTHQGKSLEPVLLQMMAWGNRRLGGGRYDPTTGRSSKPTVRL